MGPDWADLQLPCRHCHLALLLLHFLHVHVHGDRKPSDSSQQPSPLRAPRCHTQLPAVIHLPVSLPGAPSLRAYPLLSVITRQPAVISHLVPASPGIGQALSRRPVAEAGSAETPGGEALASSESETEQPTPRQKKPRRSRTIFTELQLMGLEKKFQKQKYLSTPDR